jgi:DNA-binding transcriptional regulator YiaG
MNTMTPKQVKSLRKKLGITQSELARKLGVGRSAVNNWERGSQSPLPMAVKFMKLLLQLHKEGYEYEQKEKTTPRH